MFRIKSLASLALAASIAIFSTGCGEAVSSTPDVTVTEVDNCDHRYPDYDGPAPPDVSADDLYYLNQDWPGQPTQLPVAFTEQLHAYLPINESNVDDLQFTLRAHVFDQLVAADFDQRGTGWFAVPNIGKREAMHGMYDGNNTDPGAWGVQQTQESVNFTTDLYNEVSAYTIGQMWGDCDRATNNPLINTTTSQFPEGAIVIKLAMSSIPLSEAPFLEGAFNWEIYADTTAKDLNSGDFAATVPEKGKAFNPQPITVRLIQMDMIIKDSVLAPETGWLFTTFVYDQNAAPVDMPAGTPEDKQAIYKMIPLGVQWGNDPGVLLREELEETVLNPAWTTDPPEFIANTLGLNGRLSGPIDDQGNRSSCMQCHASAEWNVNGIDDKSSVIFGTLAYPEVNWTDPQKTVWMQNFTGLQSYGNTPVSPEVTRYITDSLGMTPGPAWIGMDYDFVMTAAALNAMRQQGKLKQERVLVGKFH